MRTPSVKALFGELLNVNEASDEMLDRLFLKMAPKSSPLHLLHHLQPMHEVTKFTLDLTAGRRILQHTQNKCLYRTKLLEVRGQVQFVP